MPAIHRLPEELVREILIYALDRRLEDFFCVSEGIPRESADNVHAPPRSGILLVCKRWHRIGLPLLYTSLAIASDKQLKAVASALKVDPPLGRSISHVRLRRGSYSGDLFTILKLAKKLDAISISTIVSARESLFGLRRILPTLNPRVLCIYSPIRVRPNVKNAQLDSHIESAVQGWKSLVSSPCLKET